MTMNCDEIRAQIAEHGFCVVPGVLSPQELARARAGLDRGVAFTRELLGTTHIATLDPNDANIRVNNLPAIDPVFVELLTWPAALEAVEAAIGEHFIISNFTANIALPGSGSMNLHSDQALVVPPPWLHPWAMNVIWCLDDIDETNGATRYLPGSHHFRCADELPGDAMDRTLPFAAPAGSFVAMEGRLWHTSGRNVSTDRQRRMMFAYYSADFIRPQVNWACCLPPEVQAGLDDVTKRLMGITPMANVRMGAGLTRLQNNP